LLTPRADTPATPDPNVPTEPFATLQRAFSSQGPLDRDLFAPLLARLERLAVPAGHVLFQQGAAPADGLYVVQAGVLRARYAFADFTRAIEESMVPGTLAGELSALTGEPRNSTVVAERDAVLWRLTCAGLDELEESAPEVARRFTKMVLRSESLFCSVVRSSG
jgi:SulP family sulfate permease